MVNFLYFSMTSFFQAFFSLVRLIPCTLLHCFFSSNFIWFSPCLVYFLISNRIIWNFLFFIRLWKRNVLFVTFFMLDWSQPLGSVSAFFIFVAWCLNFASFSLDQHLICTDHCSVSATFVWFNDFPGALSFCDVCVLVRVLFWDSQCRDVQFLCRFLCYVWLKRLCPHCMLAAQS